MSRINEAGRSELLDPDLVPSRIRAAISARGTGRASSLTAVDDDDCAVVQLAAPETRIVVSTDFINASPIGLEQGFASFSDLGWLCVAVNVADVLSSGAVPGAFLLAAAMERGSLLSEFDQLIEGVLDACAEFGIDLVGGDTKLGRSRSINGTCVGVLGDSSVPFLRNAALPGDDLWLLGTAGETAAATVLLDRGATGRAAEACREQVRRPTLRFAQILEAIDEGALRAATDVSDGLAADAHAIARASNTRLVIAADLIPQSDLVMMAAERGIASPIGLQLSIGGDLSFLACAPPSSAARLTGCGFVRIGEVEDGVGVGIIRGGEQSDLLFEGHRDARQMTFAQEVLHLAGLYD